MFWYRGKWLVADKLHPVLREAVIRALARDPMCLDSCTKRLALTEFAGGLSTAHLEQIDPFGLELVQDTVLLDFQRASLVEAAVLNETFSFAIPAFSLNLGPLSSESSLVHSFWAGTATQFFNRAGLIVDLEWNTLNFGKGTIIGGLIALFW